MRRIDHSENFSFVIDFEAGSEQTLPFRLFQDESRYLLTPPIPFICIGNKQELRSEETEDIS